MVAKKEPNLGINYGWALGEDNWKDGMDANLLLLGAILNLQVTAIQNAPPTGTLTNGMRYIVGTAPTGAWAGKANQVAVLVEASWTFWAPKAGWCAQVESTASEWLYTGSAWQNKVAAVADVAAGTAPDILLASIGGVKALLDSAGVGAYLNNTANLNNATKNGFFAWNNTSTNAPVASSYGRGYTIASDANNATQYGIVNATGAMYVRFLTAGAWGAWTKVGASSAGDVGALPLTNTSLGTTDLNTLGAPDSAGVYPQTNSANATSARNYPEVVAGTLLVTPSAYSGCQQMYTTITGNVWVRALTGNWSASSPTWGSWIKVNAGSAIDLGALPLRGGIPTGRNLNSMGPNSTYNGVWGQSSVSATAADLANGYPAAERGVLEIFPYGRNNGTQRYTTDGGRVFFRWLSGSWNGVDGPWSDWTEVGGLSSNTVLSASVTTLSDATAFAQNQTYILSGVRTDSPAGLTAGQNNAIIMSMRRGGGTIMGLHQTLFTTVGTFERYGAPNAATGWTSVAWYNGGDANGWRLVGADAMAAVGIGVATQPTVSAFDWQQADFVVGQNQQVNVTGWLNAPAGLLNVAGDVVNIICDGARTANNRWTVRVMSQSFTASARYEYLVVINGPKGSRTFNVVQEFNSDPTTLIPLTNGGLGANTPAGGRKTLGFEDLGFGIAVQLPVDPFDWQQADFVTGQKRLATVGSWVKAPAAVAFGASTVANIECVLAQVNRLVLRVTSNAQSSSNRAEYTVTATGAKGTRSFTVVQSYNSDASTVIPIYNGGTGGKTLAEAQAALGINPAFLNAVADLNAALLNAPFAWINTSTNSPVAGSYGRGITIASDATNVTQIGIINDTGAMYVRYLVGTTWSAWISTTVAALPYLTASNPGTTPFPAAAYTAIPFYTSGEAVGGVTLTSNATITVPAAGLYDFELEVRVNGGATNMPPVGTVIGLSIDTTTVPTALRAGYSAAQAVDSVTILRLHCRERLAAGATRRAYLYNAGTAGYQVTSAVIKVTRVGA